MVLDGLFNTIFYPFLLLSVPWSLIAISFVLTLLVTLSYKYLTDQTLIKQLKEEVKALQGRMKEEKENKEKLTEIQKELLAKNSQLMKHNLKPTLYTFIPIIIIFGWVRKTFLPAGNLIDWGTSIPLFGTGAGWLLTYIICSIIFSIIIRKALKIQ